MDWGIVILLGASRVLTFSHQRTVILFIFFKKKGGGFALSDASLQSGLSDWLGQQLSVLRVLPPFVIMLVRALVDKKWPFFLFKK